jgi:hypothetical protein
LLASNARSAAAPDEQLTLPLPSMPHPAIERLRSLDTNAMTPLQAIQVLADLVREVKERVKSEE